MARTGPAVKRFTDAHHIDHSNLDNLALLCRLHHRLVHEDGFSLERTPRGLVFRTPEGKLVERAPKRRLLAADPVLALMSAQAERGTVVPGWMGEKADYDWIVGGLERSLSIGTGRPRSRWKVAQIA